MQLSHPRMWSLDYLFQDPLCEFWTSQKALSRRPFSYIFLPNLFALYLPYTLVFDLTPQTAVVFWELSYTRFLALKIVCCCEQFLLGTMTLRDIYSSFVGAPCSHYISVFSRCHSFYTILL
jgi:hypothetical protein